MSKLYFRYGAMNSGKSTHLMQVAHNYEERGMKVLIVKPRVDTKGGDTLVSRLGVNRHVDLLISNDENLFTIVDGYLKEGKRIEGEQIAIDEENNVEYEALCGHCYYKYKENL